MSHAENVTRGALERAPAAEQHEVSEHSVAARAAALAQELAATLDASKHEAVAASSGAQASLSHIRDAAYRVEQAASQ